MTEDEWQQKKEEIGHKLTEIMNEYNQLEAQHYQFTDQPGLVVRWILIAEVVGAGQKLDESGVTYTVSPGGVPWASRFGMLELVKIMMQQQYIIANEDDD